MGYTSQVIIAIKKEVLARDLINPEIPKAIKDLDGSVNEVLGCVFYEIQDWKWYQSFPEVQAIEDWFNHMEDIDSSDFGAIRIGEDDGDQQTWGSPYDFDIYVNRYLEYPRP